MLVPTKVANNALARVDRPEDGAVHAVYEVASGPIESISYQAQHVSDQLPALSSTYQAARVGPHDGIIYNEDKDRRVDVGWRSGAWLFNARVLYHAAADRNAAHDLAPKAATEIAAWAAPYLQADATQLTKKLRITARTRRRPRNQVHRHPVRARKLPLPCHRG